MKTHSLASGLLSILMAATPVYADNLSQGAILDLPLFDSMDNVPDSGQNLNDSSGEQVLAGSIRLPRIPRTSGGTEYRLELNETLKLERFDLRVVTGRIKIHQVAVVLSNGQEFSATVNSEVLPEGTLEKIKNLAEKGEVRGLNILAESYGQESDLLVTAVSTQKLPQLTLIKYDESRRQDVAQGGNPAGSSDPIGDVLISEGIVTPDKTTSCGTKFCTGETVIHVNVPGTITGRIVSEAGGVYTIQVGNRVETGRESDLAKTQGCDAGVCVGEFIYAGTNSGLQAAEVIGLGSTGFVLKFVGGHLNGTRGGHWSLDSLYRNNGCVATLCAGEYVMMATDKTTERGRIVGISLAGRFAVEEITGAKRGQVTVWGASGLAKTSGCSGSFCIGDVVLNVATQPITRARVIGQRQGVYVLEFLSAPYNGRLGGGWEAKNLAVTQGCAGAICVGHRVRLTQDTRISAQVLGINQGNFVIQFLNSRQKGQIQAHWPAHALTW